MSNLLERLGVDGLFRDVQRMDKRQVNKHIIHSGVFRFEKPCVIKSNHFRSKQSAIISFFLCFFTIWRKILPIHGIMNFVAS